MCLLLLQLVKLNTFAVRRLALHEPICCRLYPIVATHHAIVVHDCRRYDEVRFQIRVLAPRIFHYQSKSTALGYGKHLDCKPVEIGAVLVALQYRIGLLLDRHIAIVDAAPREVHLAWRTEVDAREKGHYQVVLADGVEQTFPPVCPFYLGKEVYLVVGLPEVVLYVVVLGWYAQFDELLLESARLLEEAATVFHLPAREERRAVPDILTYHKIGRAF